MVREIKRWHKLFEPPTLTRAPIPYIPRIICPCSQILAVAVPGNEGDCPFISLKSIIRNQSKGLECGMSMVGTSFEKTYVIYHGNSRQVVLAPYTPIFIVLTEHVMSPRDLLSTPHV